jgi:hypothetical protein
MFFSQFAGFNEKLNLQFIANYYRALHFKSKEREKKYAWTYTEMILH